jgi:hypothetical protein
MDFGFQECAGTLHRLNLGNGIFFVLLTFVAFCSSPQSFSYCL